MANWFKKALPYAAGALTGSVMSSFAPTAKYAAAGSAAAGALTNKKNPLAGTLQGGVGGGVGAAGAGALKGFTSGTGAGDQAWNAFKGYGSSIPGMGGIGTSAPKGALAKFLTPQSIQNPGQKLVQSGPARTSQGVQVPSTMTPMSAFKNTTTGATGTPSSSTPSGFNPKKLVSSIMGGGDQQGINPLMLGAGVMLPAMAGAMQPEYEPPDLSGTFNNINEKMETNPYRKQAAEYMGTTLQQPIGADASAARAVSALRSQRQKEQDLQTIMKHFQAENPGANFSNNSAYIKAVNDYNTELAASEEAQNAQLQFQYDTQQRTQNLAIAKELANMGDEQINVLLAEAGITAQQAMDKAMYDAGRGQSMTDFASTIGAELFRRGLGTPQATVAA